MRDCLIEKSLFNEPVLRTIVAIRMICDIIGCFVCFFINHRLVSYLVQPLQTCFVRVSFSETATLSVDIPEISLALGASHILVLTNLTIVVPLFFRFVSDPIEVNALSAVIKKRQQTENVPQNLTPAQMDQFRQSLRRTEAVTFDSFLSVEDDRTLSTDSQTDSDDDDPWFAQSKETCQNPGDCQTKTVLASLLLNILQLLKVHISVVKIYQTDTQIFLAYDVRKRSMLEDGYAAEIHNGFVVHVERLNLQVHSEQAQGDETQTILATPGADVFIAQELRKLIVHVRGQVRLSYTANIRDNFWSSSLPSPQDSDDGEIENSDEDSKSNWLHVSFDEDIELTIVEPTERSERFTASVVRLSKCSYTSAMQWRVRKLSLQHGRALVVVKDVSRNSARSLQIQLDNRHVGVLRNLCFTYDRYGHIEIDGNREILRFATTPQQLLDLAQTLESLGLHSQVMFPVSVLPADTLASSNEEHDDIDKDSDSASTADQSVEAEVTKAESRDDVGENESGKDSVRLMNGLCTLRENYIPEQNEEQEADRIESRKTGRDTHVAGTGSSSSGACATVRLPAASECPFAIEIRNLCLLWSIRGNDDDNDDDDNDNDEPEQHREDKKHTKDNSSLRLCALVLRATFRQLAYPTDEIQFCEYIPQNAFRLVLKEWEIRDHVSHSHWRRLVSCSGTVASPAAQLYVSQKLRYLPLPTRNSYSVRLRVMPLHVALHEATFVFLQRFFASLRSQTPPSIENVSDNDDNHSEGSSVDIDDDNSAEKTNVVLASSPYAIYSVRNEDDDAKTGACLATIEQLDIDDIRVVVDYKPQATNSLQEMMRSTEFVYLLRSVPIENAKVHLQPLRVRNMRLDLAADAIMAIYVPNWHTLVKAYVRGVQPLHVVMRLGSSAINLVKVPLKQYNDPNGDILSAMGDSLRTMTVELLRLGTRASTLSYKALRSADTFLSHKPSKSNRDKEKKKGHETESSDTTTTSSGGGGGGNNSKSARRSGRIVKKSTPIPVPKRTESIYANQPASLSEGVKDSWRHVRRGIGGGASALTREPYRAYRDSGTSGFLSATARALPCAILRPAVGVTGAVTRMTQAASNVVDPRLKAEADKKWKSSPS